MVRLLPARRSTHRVIRGALGGTLTSRKKYEVIVNHTVEETRSKQNFTVLGVTTIFQHDRSCNAKQSRSREKDRQAAKTDTNCDR